MLRGRWRLLTMAPNAPCAQALVESLREHGVDTEILADSALLGEGLPCRVMVAESMEAMARRLLAERQFTDSELAFLATGAMSCEDAKEPDGQ